MDRIFILYFRKKMFWYMYVEQSNDNLKRLFTKKSFRFYKWLFLQIFHNGLYFSYKKKVDQIWMGKIKVSVCTLSLIFTRAWLHALTNDISPFVIIFFMETFPCFLISYWNPLPKRCDFKPLYKFLSLFTVTFWHFFFLFVTHVYTHDSTVYWYFQSTAKI